MKAINRPKPTWRELTTLEPRLRQLYDRIRAIKDDKSKPYFCANSTWYGGYGYSGFKGGMLHLAGFDAANPKLRTMGAYDVAYEKLYGALPNCRNCQCVGVEHVDVGVE